MDNRSFRILIVSPPSRISHSGISWTLITLSYYFKKIGISVLTLDLNCESINKVFEHLENKQNPVVCITSLTPTASFAIELARAIVRRNDKALVFLGGVHWQNTKSDIDASNIHIVKLPTRKAIEYIAHKANIQTKPRAAFDTVEKIKWLTRHYQKYNVQNSVAGLYFGTPCLSRCKFCASGKYPSPLKWQIVISSLENLSFSKVNIWDDDFLSNSNYINILKGLNRHSRNITVNASMASLCRADSYQLSRLGVKKILIGIESFDNKVRFYLGKNKYRICYTELDSLVKHLTGLGITITMSNIIGLPKENESTIMAGIEKCNYYYERYNIEPRYWCLVPYPGSEYFKSPTRHDINILSRDYNEYLPWNVVCETSSLSSDRIAMYRDLSWSMFNQTLIHDRVRQGTSKITSIMQRVREISNP